MSTPQRRVIEPAASPAPDVLPDGVTRRSTLKWMTAAWVGFAAATAAGLTATVRFLFPNVLFEPPTRFKAGDPSTYSFGVDERWKAKYRVWVVRNSDEIYAIFARCTHLGCTPNWLQAQNKFKCPCHGSGYYMSGVNFEGPTPRPMERVEIEISPDDGQLVVDTATRFLYERGQWSDPKSFVKMV
jgi:cytochrome b6-f complex iron-sulfur subunit